MTIQCPYCLEQVDDEALACKHCGRDWMLFTPVLRRMSSIEEKLASLSAEVEQLGARLDTIAGPVLPFWKQCPVGVSALIVATAMGTLFGYLSGSTGYKWLVITCALTPFVYPLPFGLWAGLAWPGSHIRKYGLWGIAIGGAYILTRMIFDSEGPSAFMHRRYFLYIVASTLSFGTGAIFGDWIEWRRDPAELKTGFAGRMARRMIKRGNRSEEDWKARIQKRAALINTLIAVLTFLGSIVTGIPPFLKSIESIE